MLMCCTRFVLNASDSSSCYKSRQQWVQGMVFAGTPLVYGGLYSLWYADYPMKSFHWTNDSREWRGMDKCGHAFSAFQLSNQTYQWYHWSGFSQRKSAGLSAISALYFQNPLEIFDGFSQGWGASKADLMANASGALLSSAQLFFWGENKLLIRFSYTQSSFAAIRPGILGSNAAEQLMKDYNGQTYWLSASLRDLAGQKSHLPAWVNLAIGYGANGMLGGYANVWTDKNGIIHDFRNIRRSSQWYLAPDIRLSRIPVKKAWVRRFFSLLDMVKFPMPGLMLQDGQMRFRSICY